MNLIKAKGFVEVFPKDRSCLKVKKKAHEEQTIVVQVDNDFSLLYASFLMKKFGVMIERPSFGTHITVNNGRFEIQGLDLKKDYLNSLNGKEVEFEYNPEVYLYWEFFAVKVYSKELDQIRVNLGLPPMEFFHITIGKIHPFSKKESSLNREICLNLG